MRYLKLIGAFIKFDITIGYNGRIWVQSENSLDVILLYNTIMKMENIEEGEMMQLIEDIRYARQTS